ncbi:MAG: pyrimidine/purine nucleoside phosphorylase [Chromatiaceae bacterium]|nr:pyrimidine/purine nucleoside phosphorylase [Chromatiaceae bacterium]
MDPIKNVSIFPNANVYFDGKCISHTIEAADGTRKSVGVILPSTLNFSTAAPEVMQIVAGECRVRLAGDDNWQEYAGGERFAVPGDSSFDIEVRDTLHYICHFG